MNDWVIVDALDRAALPAAIYRTARRLLDLTQPGDLYVWISYEQMETICGTTSQETVRGHLSALARTGLITYRRNAAVHVMWHEDAGEVVAGHAQRAQDARNARQATTSAPDDDGDDDERRAQDARNDRSTRETRAGRAKRAQGDHPNTNANKVGREGGIDQPTYLPEGGVGGLTETQARTLALLTDPDFGMNDHTATALALRYPFERVLAHVFGVLADVEAGKVGSVYVLPSRLQRGGTPKLTNADRATALFKRHWTAQDEAEELRRKYSPSAWGMDDPHEAATAGMTPQERERYYEELLEQMKREEEVAEIRRRYIPDEYKDIIRS